MTTNWSNSKFRELLTTPSVGLRYAPLPATKVASKGVGTRQFLGRDDTKAEQMAVARAKPLIAALVMWAERTSSSMEYFNITLVQLCSTMFKTPNAFLVGPEVQFYILGTQFDSAVLVGLRIVCYHVSCNFQPYIFYGFM
jgi:hypothetical protein